VRVREKNQGLVKKFQEGSEGSIEKKISEIDFKFFFAKRILFFFVKSVPDFYRNWVRIESLGSSNLGVLRSIPHLRAYEAWQGKSGLFLVIDLSWQRPAWVAAFSVREENPPNHPVPTQTRTSAEYLTTKDFF
jgi:hypothetical protein